MKAIDSMSKRELHNEVAFLRHNIAASAGLKCPHARCNDSGQFIPPGMFEKLLCDFCLNTTDSIW